MKTMFSIFTFILLAGAFLAFHAARGADAPTTAPSAVEIHNFTYSPATLTVAAGTTVTWINHDDMPHTVTSDGTPTPLKSPLLDTDAAYKFTFTQPGRYAYHCALHPHMTGTIIVK